MLNQQQVGAILKRWGIQDCKILPQGFMPGSPERAMDRMVVEDSQGVRLVLEQLAPETFDSKTTIATRIDRLNSCGLPVVSYLKGEDGHWIQRHQGCCWQLAPLVQGVTLDRDTYWKEGWRGQAVARFLADLSEVTKNWAPEGAAFSLPNYIEDLVQQIEHHNPEYMHGIKPIYDGLRRHFYPVANIPCAFNHGDPHPINTLWGEDRILAVIDWEFCGWKPLLYDAALVVGCVGAEAPDAMNAAFITEFMDTIQKKRIYPEGLMALLPLFVAAVRFGWLSEWLRRKDVEMIEFELFYMNLLIKSLNATR